MDETKPLPKFVKYTLGRSCNLINDSKSNCGNRVPKELISRFVKSCPTCQVRRGATQISSSFDPGEDEPSSQISQKPSLEVSLKKASELLHPSSSLDMPLKTAGFNTTSTFEQQNRWMTPLSPQETMPDRDSSITAITANNNMSTEIYNTAPPSMASCSNGNSQGTNFLPSNSYSANSTSSAVCSSAQVSHLGLSHSHHYTIKNEQAYM